MQKLYLSRRNLLALLSKLDRNVKEPGSSVCTIIKQDTVHPKYPSTDVIEVVAVEDADYYYERPAGEIFYADEPTTR
jgi:hypothetical protein